MTKGIGQKKCKVCEKYQSLKTDRGSWNDGVLQIPQYSNVLMIQNSATGEEYLFTVRFCPFCGKEL